MSLEKKGLIVFLYLHGYSMLERTIDNIIVVNTNMIIKLKDIIVNQSDNMQCKKRYQTLI